MTDDSMLRQALDEYVPQVDEEPDWVDVLRRATVAGRPASRRRISLPQTRRAILATGGLAVAAAATALVLAAPWQRGPAALTQAEAAVVLKRALAAASPRPGWVFHAKSEWTFVAVAGAGHYTHLTSEVWKQNGPPYRFRLINVTAAPGVEIAGTTEPPRGFVYDKNTNTLYRDDRLAAAASPPSGIAASQDVALDELATRIREQIKAGAPVIRTSIDGRSVYRFGTGQDTPSGFDGWTYYVDTKTYVPVRIETRGDPLNQPGGRATGGSFISDKYPASKTVQRVVSYEWVPPTEKALSLSNVQAQHPGAAHADASAMPAAVQRAAHPFVLAGSLAPPTTDPAGAPVKRLLVDLHARSLGDLRLGQPLQAFMAAWGSPDQFTTSQLTLDPRNPADAAWLARDLRPWAVVGFSDTAAMHADSIYYRGPLSTVRGDRNGTPLSTFLKNWPNHATPQPQGTFMRVKVGANYVWFDADKRLLAVQVGLGRAYTLAGLPGQ